MTQCDKCKEKTETPVAVTVRYWGGGEFRYLVCAICANAVSLFLKQDNPIILPKPKST